MSKRGVFGRLACKLNLHHWNIEQRGVEINGSIFPVRFRSCVRCQLIQQEAFTKNKEDVVWVTLQETDS